MNDPPRSEPKKTGFSKKTRVLFVIAVVAVASVAGTVGVHAYALRKSLSPSSLILSAQGVSPVMQNAGSWEIFWLPNGGDVASRDYSNTYPIPSFGGNVTYPNIVLILVKNSTNETAVSGYNYLSSNLDSIIGMGVEQGRLTYLNATGYPGEFLGFYNDTKSTGAVVATVYSYILVVVVFNLDVKDLMELFTMQHDKIQQIISFDSTNFVL